MSASSGRGSGRTTPFSTATAPHACSKVNDPLDCPPAALTATYKLINLLSGSNLGELGRLILEPPPLLNHAYHIAYLMEFFLGLMQMFCLQYPQFSS
jgi:hypothetical protein